MPKYTVQSPIKSGGKIHDIGATVALDVGVAAPLLALGRITALDAAKNFSEEGSTTDDETGDAAQQAAEPRPAAGKPKGAKK